MIEITIGEVRSLVMFHQMDGKKLYDKSLEIVETYLWAWWLGSMARPKGNS